MADGNLSERDGDADTRPDTVVFDVGRVLYQWRLDALLKKVLPDPSKLEFCRNYVITEEWHSQHDRGVPLAKMVPQRIEEYPEYDDALQAYATRFNETIPGPVAGTHALVERLDKAGVPLFALTNFGADFWAAFRPTAPIFGRFKDIIVSGIEKMAKPDPAIFKLTEQRIGRPAERLFLVDDNAENVAAAEALGWHGHVFTDAKTLEIDLVKHGLLKR